MKVWKTLKTVAAAMIAVACSGLPAYTQPGGYPPPEGVTLTARETTLDRGTFASTTLHLVLHNGSSSPIAVALNELPFLDLYTKDPNVRIPGCQVKWPDSPPPGRMRQIAPEEAYTMDLPLSRFGCPGIEKADHASINLGLVSRSVGLVTQVRGPTLTMTGELNPQTAVLNLLEWQTLEWNACQIQTFAQGYKESPEILFIGRTVRRGYDEMVESYEHNYPTCEKMGKLTFSQLEVQPLGAKFVTATGHFHLVRTAAGGGNADGFFLLVLEETASGWKIVRDDTTALPADGQPVTK